MNPENSPFNPKTSPFRNLLLNWWIGLTRPRQAVETLRFRSGPSWGLAVVFGSNVVISCTTLLSLLLLQRGPLIESAFTFIPSEDYLAAEIFFLPFVRTGLWLLTAAMIHVGLRLFHQSSDIDLILNLGGLATLVIIPFILFSDWLLIAFNIYRIEIAAFPHAGAALWGWVWTVRGLRQLLKTPSLLAAGLATLTTALSILVLSVVAR